MILTIKGCSSGFGLHFAKRLNEYGFTVFAGCRSPEAKGPKSLSASVKHPEKLILVKLDVCCDTSVKLAFERIRTSLSNNEQLWAVVNNAGIALPNELEWCDIETDFKRTFDVNVFGMFRVCQAALPLLHESKGRIVNISSITSKAGIVMIGAYAASKAALSHLSRTLRREVRKFGINVICVEPSFYATDMIGFETNRKSLVRGWEGLPESIKSVYGVKYLNEMICMTKANSNPNNLYVSTDIDEVSRCVEAALTLNHPEQTYVPMATVSRPFLWFLAYMPNDFHEFFSYLTEYAMSFLNLISSESYVENKSS